MVDTPATPPAAKPPIVELKNVTKRFAGNRLTDRIVAVEDISLSIPDEEAGEFVALLGPSGCGKSTILNMIGGAMEPDDGTIRIFGKEFSGDDRFSATVSQSYTCYPWLSVLGNVEFGLSMTGASAEDRRKIAMDCLTKVGLEDRAAARPKELSGGMQQRVAIARTLAVKPPIVLMDEPFGALDAQTRSEMQQMLLRIWTEERNLIIFVTHDITEALLLADRVLVFSPRPARIIHDMKVPFARPRGSSLCFEQEFVHLTQSLLELLKSHPNGGQVRVSL
ncbi:MAG TPA: ABC transporter ATP-binding protein [Armatimonadota bacterium]|jgi:NitT/TauT family transport system ATP-binding protein